jgi:hypothetical protein
MASLARSSASLGRSAASAARPHTASVAAVSAPRELRLTAAWRAAWPGARAFGVVRGVLVMERARVLQALERLVEVLAPREEVGEGPPRVACARALELLPQRSGPLPAGPMLRCEGPRPTVPWDAVMASASANSVAALASAAVRRACVPGCHASRMARRTSGEALAEPVQQRTARSAVPHVPDLEARAVATAQLRQLGDAAQPQVAYRGRQRQARPARRTARSSQKPSAETQCT